MFVNTVTDLVEGGLEGAPLRGGRGWVLRAGAVVAFVLVWSLASGLVVLGNLFNPIFLAGPWRVLGKVAELAATGQLWGHVAATLERVVVGFATGALLALALGLPAGPFPLVPDRVAAGVEILQPVLPLAVLPLFLVSAAVRATTALTLM